MKKEFDYQKAAHKKHPTLVPKPHKIVFFKITNKFVAGILMEHIKGKTLSEVMGFDQIDELLQKHKAYVRNGKLHKSSSPRNKTTMEEFVQGMLEMVNLYHDDLHWGNILITPKKEVKVIDFGMMRKYRRD